LVVPYKTTLLIINYGGTAFCSTGTVQNFGTIIVSVLNPSVGFANYEGAVFNYGVISIINNAVGGTGFLNYFGTVYNGGVIAIVNNAISGTAFSNFGGTVNNYDGITISSNVAGYIGFDNSGTVSNHGTINSCGSVGSGLIIESGSTYSGTPVISC
jgi:hypothetical protein